MTRPLALVFAATLVLASRASDAKPKIALTEIEGDTKGDVRDAVAEAIEGDELSLISSKEVNRAVNKLGDLADLTEKDFRKLANELEADAIVLGKLDKAGGARTLRFRLFVGKKMAKGFTVSFKDAKSDKFRSLLHDKMVDKLGATASSESAEEEEEERPARSKRGDDEERPARSKRAEDDTESLARKDRKDRKPRRTAAEEDGREEEPEPGSEGDAERDSDSEDNPDGEAAPRKARKKVAATDADEGTEVEAGVARRTDRPRSANRAAFRVDVGVSVLQRSFKFNANDFPERPKNLSLSPVPGARFEVEGYPLALYDAASPLAGLGFGVEYDRTLSLTLQSNVMTERFRAPVKQMHYSLGLRYRLALGKTETSPTITAGVGYGKRLFSVDLEDVTNAGARDELLRDAPSTEHSVIDPGIALRFPVTRAVAFGAGGRGMIITRTGPIQKGSSYGRATVYGVQALVALDVVLGSRFALRFSGDFVQIGYTFKGVGSLSNGLDGNPDEADVGGLADRSIGGAATFAVMY